MPGAERKTQMYNNNGTLFYEMLQHQLSMTQRMMMSGRTRTMNEGDIEVSVFELEEV